MLAWRALRQAQSKLRVAILRLSEILSATEAETTIVTASYFETADRNE